MDTLTAFKKFVTGYNLNWGMKMAFAVIFPSLILFHYGVLGKFVMLPFGVIMVGFVDSPGAFIRRFYSLLIAVLTYALTALIAGYTRDIFWLSIVELLIFACFYSLIGIYGARMTSVGTSALMCFIFFLDKNFVGADILPAILYMSIGGVWFILIFLISYKLRPYKLIQQLLGEHMIELAQLLRFRSQFYLPKYNREEVMDALMSQQVVLRGQQENLREAVLKTRQIVNESSNKSRALLLIFMDTIDLYERILLSQQDYDKLHKAFDDMHILQLFGRYIAVMANELEEIGLALQQGRKSINGKDLSALYEKCKDNFYDLRTRKMNGGNMEDFIMLRQILYSLQDLTERIIKLEQTLTLNKSSKEARQDMNFNAFVPKQEYDIQLFWNNISLRSELFRHAIRVSLALLLGLIVSRFFSLGHHSYWVLMTIIIILKPSYSLARKKNLDRIGGTLMGGALSFLIIYLVKDQTVMFVILCIATILTCSLIRINYFIYAIGMTMMVILSYDFLSAKILSEVLMQRVVNSAIGCGIGYLVSLFVLPNWEHKQNGPFVLAMLLANREYFKSVAGFFMGEPLNVIEFKLFRKNAFIALANLSDNFQRMLSDPQKQRVQQKELHQLVVTSHMMCSYIASLSFYTQKADKNYVNMHFKDVINQIDQNFEATIQILNDGTALEDTKLQKSLPINTELLELLENRKQELREQKDNEGNQNSIRKSLTDYNSINGLFELINKLIYEDAKIVAKFKLDA